MQDSEKKQFNVALLICLIVIVLFAAFILPDFVSRGDYDFHYNKASGGTDDTYHTPVDYEVYAYLSHIIASPFAYNQFAYYYFMLFLLALVTPMLLFILCRKWIVVLLYFCCSSYFMYMFETMSQAMACILLLLMFVYKDNRIRLGILLISPLVHGQGFLLIGVTFLILVFFENIKLAGTLFPTCTVLVGEARPNEILDVPLSGTPGFGFGIGAAITFFSRILGLPFLILGVWQHIKDRRWDFIGVSLFAFTGAFFHAARISYVIPLMILPGVANYYCKSWPKKYKALFFTTVLLWGIFEFVYFLNRKVVCG